MSAISIDTSSATRMPVAYSSSRIAALRCDSGGDSGVVALVCTGGCLTAVYGIGRLISCLASCLAAAGRGCRSPIVLVLVCCNGMFSDIQ